MKCDKPARLKGKEIKHLVQADVCPERGRVNKQIEHGMISSITGFNNFVAVVSVEVVQIYRRIFLNTELLASYMHP